MRILVLVGMLFALSFTPPYTDAALRPRHTTTSTLVKNHITQKVGKSFADALFADPRFALDPTLFSRRPRQLIIPQPHSRKPDYDYVFSDWSRAKGKYFLQNNKIAFDREEETFGVPRDIVNALLNIETQWGRVIGNRPVVTTLYTLAVMRPNRIQPGWPEEQLIAFLVFCKENHLDPFSIKGSRTGAFGLAQFEPTSYSIFAIHCEADNDPPDLFNDADAICSIGNYLHRAGWGSGEASHRKAILAYNHDRFYAAAVMDYADLTSTNALPRRYRFTRPIIIKEAAIK